MYTYDQMHGWCQRSPSCQRSLWQFLKDYLMSKPKGNWWLLLSKPKQKIDAKVALKKKILKVCSTSFHKLLLLWAKRSNNSNRPFYSINVCRRAILFILVRWLFLTTLFHCSNISYKTTFMNNNIYADPHQKWVKCWAKTKSPIKDR